MGDLEAGVRESAEPDGFGMQLRAEILVYGATPCGISAAIAASRYGRSVVLIAAGSHLGGMMTSGLSITDLRFRSAFGGIFEEFTRSVWDYYKYHYGDDSPQAEQCNGGLWFEPHVAEHVFQQMLDQEANITIRLNRSLEEVGKRGSQVESAVVRDRQSGKRERWMYQTAIDASYEGDLMAAAGASYRVGRESREEYGEPYAGRIFLRNPGLQVLDGSSGEGDRLIQAYNYRLCLTNRDDLRILPTKPTGYNRQEYTALIALCRTGSVGGLNDVVRLAPLPNGKYNANNRPVVRSLDLPEANTDYPDGSEETRKQIVDAYRDYMCGLLWFMQNDEEVPEEIRQDARRWGFCADEFADNGHIPYELYVREARRLIGRNTFTAHDAFLQPGSERAPIHHDSVAVGDYHVDSHIVQRQRADWPQMEGHVYLRPLSKPAQIPYGVMVPVEVEGLLVPGALSATHLGFSVLRMEPPWMALGQAAGTAAHLALARGERPSEIPVGELQQLLLEGGQVITFYYDVPVPDGVWQTLNIPFERTRLDPQVESPPQEDRCVGIQYFGTKGFFNSYYARPYDPVTRSEAACWLVLYMRSSPGTWSGLPPASPLPFPDLKPGHPDYDPASVLHSCGIVEGWRDTGGFYGAVPLSRQDAVNWLLRMMDGLTGKGEPWRCRWAEGWSYFKPLFGRWRWPEEDGLTFVTRKQYCDMLYHCEQAKAGRMISCTEW